MNRLSWNGSTFALTDYCGASVSIAGSATSGIQEWLNLCGANGMPGEAAAPPAHPFVLFGPVTVNGSLMNVEIIGRIVTQGIGIYSAFVFNYFQCSYFRHRGIIEYEGVGHPLQLIPQSAGPGGISIDYSEIHFGALDLGGSPGLLHCVHIDPTMGAINNNKISFRSINGAGKAQFGIWIISPDTQIAGNSCFGQNDIDVGLVTACSIAGIQEGNAHLVPSRMALGTNKWEIGAITTGGNLAYGFITCGLGNIVRIGSISNNGISTIGTGIYFGSGTFLNQVQITQNEGVTQVQNSGDASNVVSP